MKSIFLNHWKVAATFAVIMVTACGSPDSKKTAQVKDELNGFKRGTYGYDLEFLKKNNIETIELKDDQTGASVLVAPLYQGRIMTSTASGPSGYSFGWLNYDLISSGQVLEQFNPVGGEERFWLGPEGGPFSIYFAPGKEQVYDNWIVPPLIDTEGFDVTERGKVFVQFAKSDNLTNASGFNFKLGIERKVVLLHPDTLTSLLGVSIPSSLRTVAYQTENKLVNQGENSWTRESGLLSVWMLSMFNPSPGTTVFIPFHQTAGGVIVNDDYFGKVPPARLIVDESVIYFRIDGEYRSKIGIPPGRAKELCGSYDKVNQILTLLWCTIPESGMTYVNSKWGDQDDPFNGDVINSYNDGPLADGSMMGPFYEIETSSPAAELLPGESITHIQRIIHLQGEENELGAIVKSLFGLNLGEITGKFREE